VGVGLVIVLVRINLVAACAAPAGTETYIRATMMRTATMFDSLPILDWFFMGITSLNWFFLPDLYVTAMDLDGRSSQKP
jgi:hypothetical protein